MIIAIIVVAVVVVSNTITTTTAAMVYTIFDTVVDATFYYFFKHFIEPMSGEVINKYSNLSSTSIVINQLAIMCSKAIFLCINE